MTPIRIPEFQLTTAPTKHRPVDIKVGVGSAFIRALAVEDVRMTAAQHELVLYSRDEHVVTITLNRPEKRNAFNAELVKELG